MSSHTPGIIWVDEWNHNTCISVLCVFWSVLLVASLFTFALCFLQIFCQSLLFHLSFLGWMLCLLCLNSSYPHQDLCTCHTLSLSSILWALIISVLMSCHSVHVQTALSTAYWFQVHSVVAVLSLPINSSALLFGCLLSLWNCSDLIVSLY